MSFSEAEREHCLTVFEIFREICGPPLQTRAQLDWGCTISGQSIELFEIRPRFDNPEQHVHIAFAKATYVKTTGHWKVYWMLASGTWASYSPCPEVQSLAAAFRLVFEDKAHCFFAYGRYATPAD